MFSKISISVTVLAAHVFTRSYRNASRARSRSIDTGCLRFSKRQAIEVAARAFPWCGRVRAGGSFPLEFSRKIRVGPIVCKCFRCNEDPSESWECGSREITWIYGRIMSDNLRRGAGAQKRHFVPLCSREPGPFFSSFRGKYASDRSCASAFGATKIPVNRESVNREK